MKLVSRDLLGSEEDKKQEIVKTLVHFFTRVTSTINFYESDYHAFSEEGSNSTVREEDLTDLLQDLKPNLRALGLGVKDSNSIVNKCQEIFDVINQ